jgi:hypothetical protein
MQSIKEYNNHIVFEQLGDSWLLSNFVQRNNDFVEITLTRTCLPPMEMDNWIEA